MRATAFALCLLATACAQQCSKDHEDMAPEEVLEAYLEASFNAQSIDDRTELIEYTTGSLRAAIAQASDETFHAAYVSRKQDFLRYSLVERYDRTPRETEITYQVAYLQHAEALPDGTQPYGGKATEVSTENRVVMVREDGLWLIKAVEGARTHFIFPDTDIRARK